jgi:hypothetical protein
MPGAHTRRAQSSNKRAGPSVREMSARERGVSGEAERGGEV